MAPTRNYPMCKNSRRYNRTRNFGLYGHAESKKTQKFVFRSALRPNQISFSHDQDPFRTCAVFVPALGSRKDHRTATLRVCFHALQLTKLIERANRNQFEAHEVGLSQR